MTAGPLAGCRILDLGIITAGAATSALLADLGAEVIKIESPTYRDPFRLWPSALVPEDPDELPPFFRMTNRNKLSLSLDLKTAAGREIFLRLVANSDVVVENFSRGVMARLRIEFAALRAARPGIILASISSQGETGPDADYVSFGSTLEAMAGMASMTGYPGGAPVVTGNELNYPDQVVALFAAGMVSAAWRARQQGGDGVHLDLSQRELTSFLAGDVFADLAAAERRGNAQPPYAVQDCFRCRDGQWIAVSLETRDLGTIAVLLEIAPVDRAALAAALADWAKGRDAADCIAVLRGAGLVAAPVLDAVAVLNERGTAWADAMQRLPNGQLVKGFPFQSETTPLTIDCEARRLGSDSADVLRRVGGYDDAEIAALVAAGIVETAAAS